MPTLIDTLYTVLSLKVLIKNVFEVDTKVLDKEIFQQLAITGQGKPLQRKETNKHNTNIYIDKYAHIHNLILH